MNFNLTNINEANHITEILFENISNPAYLIDRHRKIRYANKAFSNFLNKHADQIIFQDLCKTIGCIYHSYNKENVHPQCKICQLDELLTEPGEKEISMVREFIIGNKSELKYLQYNSFPVHFQNETLLLVIIRDLTEETLFKIASGEIIGET